VARMGETRNLSGNLMRKFLGKHPRGRPRIIREDKIKISLKPEAGPEDRRWMALVHDRAQRKTLTLEVLNLRVLPTTVLVKKFTNKWKKLPSARMNYNKIIARGRIQNFLTGRLERELQMVQLFAIKCSCIAILWVSLLNFATITLCVASQRVFGVDFVMTQSGNVWINPRISLPFFMIVIQ